MYINSLTIFIVLIYLKNYIIYIYFWHYHITFIDLFSAKLKADSIFFCDSKAFYALYKSKSYVNYCNKDIKYSEF